MQLGLQIPDFTTPDGPARLGADLGTVARTAEASSRTMSAAVTMRMPPHMICRLISYEMMYYLRKPVIIPAR